MLARCNDAIILTLTGHGRTEGRRLWVAGVEEALGRRLAALLSSAFLGAFLLAAAAAFARPGLASTTSTSGRHSATAATPACVDELYRRHTSRQTRSTLSSTIISLTTR